MFEIFWLFVRLITLFIFAGILIDIEIFLLVFGFLFLHINMGLKAILYDYIHFKKINLSFYFFMRIFMIELIRYSCELLL